MAVRFSVLASGSSGNACLLEAHGFGLLVDAGLGPRLLASRLSAIGANWSSINALILTHTHSDHWNDRTFNHLIRPRIPLYCHALHHASLRQASPAFYELRTAGLVQCYEVAKPLRLSPYLTCYPLPLKHDDAITCGFRFEVAAQGDSSPVAIGYVADLGTWQTELADVLANVDLLGLEFNHDVHMQETSGRPPQLIERVLGDRGHLSNAQAAALLREVLRKSQPHRLRHVVQLHLSRHCNRPALALQAARAAVKHVGAEAQIHTAEQFHAGPALELSESISHHGVERGEIVVNAAQRGAMIYQPLLPGFD